MVLHYGPAVIFSVFINNRYFTVYTLRLVPKEAETKELKRQNLQSELKLLKPIESALSIQHSE